ncbi:LADA_0E05776g1_1 [Lachancea dasiensis]|uniref:LADA_0E05776g1_1 n=1 Tax=Lachancea dasiensis TaxID=1072105 RepID=A0A1G4JCV2_9SACH|nr:LADA_0E05776g1_1 [Lachancea dasiensis]
MCYRLQAASVSVNSSIECRNKRKRKISVWVKRIIQPNKDQHFGNNAADTTHSTTMKSLHSPSAVTGSNSQRHKRSVAHRNSRARKLTATTGTAAGYEEVAPQKQDPQPRSVVWDKSVIKDDPLPSGMRLDFDQNHDNASTAPLISHCSSSAKSSVFSDVTSLQSTRATVLSNKTMDTNSSTVGIPPASILDRSRQAGAPSIFSIATTHQTSQANSVRQFSL